MAVLGTLNMIRGFNPRIKAPKPPCLYKALAALLKPLTFRNDSLVEMPLVCKAVFIQSKGLVKAAAIPPAIPPETQW